MVDTTDRLTLPLLAPGQAQKELFHNEALQLLDLAVQPVVAAVGLDTPPTDPAIGQCWIAGAAPTGAWTGRSGALCGWTPGGWRFLIAREGFTAWSLADNAQVRRTASAWIVGEVVGQRIVVGGVQVVGARRPAIAGPSGGATIDAEARSTLAALAAALVAHGLIAA